MSLLTRNGSGARSLRLSFHRALQALACSTLLLGSHAYSNAGPVAFDDLIEVNPSYIEPGSPLKHQEQSVVAAIPIPAIVQDAVNIPAGMNKIAIIIDDMGYNYSQGVKAIALPGAITYAIIPHSPKASFFALEAQKHNKEVMLHAPMSTVHNTPLGKHGLTENMNEADFKEALRLSLDSLPGAIGVNNHMGSLLTQKSLPMEWVMQSLKKRRLYFIDSRTTASSVAWQVAQDFNIPSLKRDVFLDHTPTTAFIAQQFKLLISIAKRKGYAVAIAHPYPETINYLKQQLPMLAQHNIALVPASELVFGHSPNLMSLKNTKSVTQIPKTLLK